MLEVRYNKTSKEITGWCGDETQFGNLKNRGNEVIVSLDIGIPDKPIEAWLYDKATLNLILKPNYIELELSPVPRRDLATEIDELKDRIVMLEDIVTSR